jgi:hypothetical protein
VLRSGSMSARRLAVALALCTGCPVENPAWDGRAVDDTGDGSGDTSGDAGTTGDGPTSNLCPPLPVPAADAIVVDLDPSQAAELDEIIATAAANTTFRLADGTYDRSGQPTIVVSAAGVVLRSASGDPSAVILDGGSTANDLVTVRADDVTVAELSLRNGGDDLLVFDPVGGPGVRRPRVHRVSFVDAVNFQLVAEADIAAGAFVDDGEVSCSAFSLTDEFRATTADCTSAGGIKAFAASGWRIRDNLVHDFWCPDSPAFIAVHIGYGAHGTIVERNRFRDAYRGLMLGFEAGTLGTRAPPPDSGCPAGAQHVGGSIRNNMFWTGGPDLAGASFQPDSMISVWSACEVDVQHNTLVSLYPLFSMLEYRFSDSTGSIVNNLVTGGITARDPAAIVEAGNLVDVGQELFVDPGAGDLHLAVGAAAAIDASVVAGAGAVADDFDAQTRDERPDVGADELDP